MSELVEEFATHLTLQGRSPQTVRGYRKDMRQFLRENNISDVSGITRVIIDAWLLALRERQLADGTIVNRLWALKAFLKWLDKEKGVECYRFDVPIPWVKTPDYVEYLEPDELEIIFSLIDTETLHGMRLRTYIEVMINTGLRPTEALNLRSEEIVGNEITIIGKGKKPRKVFFNRRARHWIDAYLNMRTDTCTALFATNPKYAPHLPRPISLRRMEEHFKEVFAMTGLRKRVTLHTLRHTYATTLLSRGCPTEYVARLLGHRSVETTRRHYLSIQHKHAREAHFRFLSYDTEAPTVDLNDEPFATGGRHTRSRIGEQYDERAAYIQWGDAPQKAPKPHLSRTYEPSTRRTDVRHQGR